MFTFDDKSEFLHCQLTKDGVNKNDEQISWKKQKAKFSEQIKKNLGHLHR